LKPQLEKVFLEEAPVASPERSSYPMARELPGSPFSPNMVTRSELIYDANGSLLLLSGDYVFPVITYCMNPGGKSPDGHIYSLSKLEGKRAAIIRSLNLSAPPKFSIQDIQIVSWSLQTGLSYQEMTETSKIIIDEVIPQFRPQLTESFLSIFEKKWNRVSSASIGVPSKALDGTEVKTLPDGTVVVKRPAKNGKLATLEVQPAKDSLYLDKDLRIKVRYP
jgi:hypothetical protein